MIGLPILIHLINRLRHRRVEWAAMEFLLKSHKRNRNWIWLKQLLLLLSRIGLLLLALLLLSEVGCQQDRLARLLGGSTTHHYILIDDSFSMSDTGSDGPAFDHARSTIKRLIERTENRPNQLVTLVRCSNVRQSDSRDNEVDQTELESISESNGEQAVAADLNGVLIDSQFEAKLRSLQSRMEVSNLSIGIADGAQIIARWIQSRRSENAIVYVLSDFRQRDFKTSDTLATEFKTIYDTGAAIELIRCVADERANLSISGLTPAGSVRVAGTPMMMELTVKNGSSKTATNVQIKIGTLSLGAAALGDTTPAKTGLNKVEELPAVFIAEVPARQSVSQRFPVFFATAGSHVVVAELAEDAIAVDNRRWCVVETKRAASVLLIDNSERSQSQFLQLALNPNRMTGIQPEIKPKEFLRDTNLETLNQFDAIFLLDIDILDERAVSSLESFVNAGGGLAVFTGPRTNFEFFNQSLYRDGSGLLPMPLKKAIEIPELVEERVPDIAPQSHPIFAPVFGMKNSLLDLVQIQQIVVPPIEWSPVNESQVIATVRGESRWPLVIEKRNGNGRVMLFTTTAGPTWNNWSRNATFPPILLLLEDYLAANKYPGTDYFVGAPIELLFPSDAVQRNAKFQLMVSGDPQQRQLETIGHELTLTPSPTNTDQLTARIGNFSTSSRSSDTDDPGIFELTLRTADSATEVRRLAINVNPSEGEMALLGNQELLEKLPGVQPVIVNWDQVSTESKQPPASSLRRLLLMLLVVLLVIEQTLAYLLSYHQTS